jgi:hypothetical protein
MRITIDTDGNAVEIAVNGVPNGTNHVPLPEITPDNGWVGGNDICATCPNRPGGPLNGTGFCNCAIPSVYGPGRVAD